MRHKLAASLGSLALCAAGALAFVPAASAGETEASAAQTRARFSLYEHDDYKGRFKHFRQSDRELGNNWIQNEASSMKNRTGRHIILYNIGNGGSGSCGGVHYTARPHSVDSDFSNNDFDNKASCVVFT